MAKSFKRKLENVFKIVTVALCVAVTIICFIRFDNAAFDLKRKITRLGDSYVRLVDVGQGDSILLHSGGYTALIDTGPAENSHKLIANLNSSGIDIIDALILTHLHIDHTGGITEIYNNFAVENLILPELSTFSEGIYSASFAIDKMTRAGKGVYTGEAGMTFLLGDIEVEIIANYGDLEVENNRSLIIKAVLGGKSFLFMGDAEFKTEQRLISDGKDINCNVLKVAHHGSSTSTTRDFLKIATPDISLISVGKNNAYKHPHASTLTLLKNFGSKIYRTDKHGSITLRVENNEIKIETEK